MLASILTFRTEHIFRVSNYTIVILAGLGECGFQESIDRIVRHCRKKGCFIDQIYENMGTRMFTVTNAIIEIVTAVS